MPGYPLPGSVTRRFRAGALVPKHLKKKHKF